MINLINLRNEAPYDLFTNYYNEALKAGQENIEAIAISSFSKKINEVNSRYVNLKIINEDKFIFFSNYESVKSKEFVTHNQISALIYWNAINVQIRMKGYIKKTYLQKKML
jgi:pyridoxamine 5'-phosphate oxidase